MSLDEVKQSFLHLCRQYEHMGELMAWMGLFIGDERAVKVAQSVVKQHKEMGEQLKVLGMGLDGLGGDPVLIPISRRVDDN